MAPKPKLVLPCFRPIPVPHTRRPPQPLLPPLSPFFENPEHTRPTKWSLYRPLLRRLGGHSALKHLGAGRVSHAVTPSKRELRRMKTAGELQAYNPTVSSVTIAYLATRPPLPLTPKEGAPYPNLLALLRARWRTLVRLTSLHQARTAILAEEAIASSVDSELRDRDVQAGAVLQRRYSALVAEETKRIPLFPVLTGGFVRPGLTHPPLPRLKPQPPKIGGMILSRIRSRSRRIARQREIQSQLDDVTQEGAFWADAGVEMGEEERRAERDMIVEFKTEARGFNATFAAEAARARAVFEPRLYDRIMKAKERGRQLRKSGVEDGKGVRKRTNEHIWEARRDKAARKTADYKQREKENP